METGIFAKGDAEFTAEMLQAATVKFGIPQLFSRLTLPKLEREFEGVMDLLLQRPLCARRRSRRPQKARAKQDASCVTALRNN